MHLFLREAGALHVFDVALRRWHHTPAAVPPPRPPPGAVDLPVLLSELASRGDVFRDAGTGGGLDPEALLHTRILCVARTASGAWRGRGVMYLLLLVGDAAPQGHWALLPEALAHKAAGPCPAAAMAGRIKTWRQRSGAVDTRVVPLADGALIQPLSQLFDSERGAGRPAAGADAALWSVDAGLGPPRQLQRLPRQRPTDRFAAKATNCAVAVPMSMAEEMALATPPAAGLPRRAVGLQGHFRGATVAAEPAGDVAVPAAATGGGKAATTHAAAEPALQPVTSMFQYSLTHTGFLDLVGGSAGTVNPRVRGANKDVDAPTTCRTLTALTSLDYTMSADPPCAAGPACVTHGAVDHDSLCLNAALTAAQLASARAATLEALYQQLHAMCREARLSTTEPATFVRSDIYSTAAPVKGPTVTGGAGATEPDRRVRVQLPAYRTMDPLRVTVLIPHEQRPALEAAMRHAALWLLEEGGFAGHRHRIAARNLRSDNKAGRKRVRVSVPGGPLLALLGLAGFLWRTRGAVTLTVETYNQKLRSQCVLIKRKTLKAGSRTLRAANAADAPALIRALHAYLWRNGCRNMELLLGVGVVLETETSPGGPPGWTAVPSAGAAALRNFWPVAGGEGAAAGAGAAGEAVVAPLPTPRFLVTQHPVRLYNVMYVPQDLAGTTVTYAADGSGPRPPHPAIVRIQTYYPAVNGALGYGSVPKADRVTTRAGNVAAHLAIDPRGGGSVLRTDTYGVAVADAHSTFVDTATSFATEGMACRVEVTVRLPNEETAASTVTDHTPPETDLLQAVFQHVLELVRSYDPVPIARFTIVTAEARLQLAVACLETLRDTAGGVTAADQLAALRALSEYSAFALHFFAGNARAMVRDTRLFVPAIAALAGRCILGLVPAGAWRRLGGGADSSVDLLAAHARRLVASGTMTRARATPVPAPGAGGGRALAATAAVDAANVLVCAAPGCWRMYAGTGAASGLAAHLALHPTHRVPGAFHNAGGADFAAAWQARIEALHDPVQAAAYEHAVRGHDTLLSGPAGTGKSTVLGMLAQRLTATYGPDAVALVASTGVATEALSSTGLDTTTLHSFFGIGTGSGTVDDFLRLLRGKDGGARAKRLKFVLLDEIGNVSGQLLDRLLTAVSIVRDDPSPTAGVTWLASGCALQLQPVGSDATFFFEAKLFPYVWSHSDIFRFEKPHRLHQPGATDEAVARMSRVMNRMRFGLNLNADFEWIATWGDTVKEALDCARDNPVHDAARHPLPMQAAQLHRHVTAVNAEWDGLLARTAARPALVVVPSTTTNAHGVTDAQWEQAGAAREVRLRVGMRVQLTVNLPHVGAGLHNTCLGVVREVRQGSGSGAGAGAGAGRPVQVVVDFDRAGRHTIEPFSFPGPVHAPAARREALPLRPGYCVTHHGCQGLTADPRSGIVVHTADTFAAGSTYTCMTRATSPATALAEGLTRQHVVVNKKAAAWYVRLMEEKCPVAYEQYCEDLAAHAAEQAAEWQASAAAGISKPPPAAGTPRALATAAAAASTADTGKPFLVRQMEYALTAGYRKATTCAALALGGDNLMARLTAAAVDARGASDAPPAVPAVHIDGDLSSDGSGCGSESSSSSSSSSRGSTSGSGGSGSQGGCRAAPAARRRSRALAASRGGGSVPSAGHCMQVDAGAATATEAPPLLPTAPAPAPARVLLAFGGVPPPVAKPFDCHAVLSAYAASSRGIGELSDADAGSDSDTGAGALAWAGEDEAAVHVNHRFAAVAGAATGRACAQAVAAVMLQAAGDEQQRRAAARKAAAADGALAGTAPLPSAAVAHAAGPAGQAASAAAAAASSRAAATAAMVAAEGATRRHNTGVSLAAAGCRPWAAVSDGRSGSAASARARGTGAGTQRWRRRRKRRRTGTGWCRCADRVAGHSGAGSRRPRPRRWRRWRRHCALCGRGAACGSTSRQQCSGSRFRRCGSLPSQHHRRQAPLG